MSKLSRIALSLIQILIFSDGASHQHTKCSSFFKHNVPKPMAALLHASTIMRTQNYVQPFSNSIWMLMYNSLTACNSLNKICNSPLIKQFKKTQNTLITFNNHSVDWPNLLSVISAATSNALKIASNLQEMVNMSKRMRYTFSTLLCVLRPPAALPPMQFQSLNQLRPILSAFSTKPNK